MPRQGRGHKRKYLHKRGQHQFTAPPHDTRSLGPSHAPPQKAAASTNQQDNEAAETNSLQALQGSTATPPTGACSPLLAAVQASLLPASRGVEHYPTISRPQKKPHADAIHFLRKWCCRAESCANNPQHVTQSLFPLSHKKTTNVL
ncbi:hypothetical protein TcCL_Unassigned00107 [Trypanosoma cruzi]|nr:hypothetical protein TcCL_Unassigned00107 [Trypanosoma cruzi]